MSDKCALILSAGEGKRMMSAKPKVMSELLFKPMVDWVISAVKKADIDNICIVVGFMREKVEKHLDGKYEIAVQDNGGYGTGYAVMCAREFIESHRGGDVLILCGDAPLIDQATIESAYIEHKSQNNAVTVITAKLQNPKGYGRIIRNTDGKLAAIVEENDANEKIKAVNEVNSGTYWFSADALLNVLGNIGNNNAKNEYYLTDAIELLSSNGGAGAYTSDNTDVTRGANNRVQLAELNEIKRRQILEYHMNNGVDIPCADGVIIDDTVEIGQDTVILPNTILRNNVKIGSNCKIGPNSLIENSTVGNAVKLNNVQCYQSQIDDSVACGPFVHIRPNSHLCTGVYIGDFVEVKNSTLGDSCHLSHLTYVGDSDVGKRVNFGCGTVTVNYNGITKARCDIGDDCFIGCNTNLIAPVKIGNGAYTAAGSTITKDVEENGLGIERAEQKNIEGFATRHIEKYRKIKEMSKK